MLGIERAVMAIACLLAICGAAAGEKASQGSRDSSVRDGIEMTELADPAYLRGSPACANGASSVAKFSPDRSEFLVVLRRGDVDRNWNHYEVLLWKTRDLRGHPKTVLQMDSSSARPAIDPSSISWAEGGKAFTFLGEQPGGHHQVFSVDIATGHPRALTGHSTSVMSYSRDASGAVLAYEALPPVESLWNATTARHGLVVTSQWPQNIIMGQRTDSVIREGDRELFIKNAAGTHEIQPVDGSIFYGGDSDGSDVLSLSPDGRYVVVLERVAVAAIPRRWREYRDWYVQFDLDNVQGAYGWLGRYVLVNTQTGKSRVLLNVPVVIPTPVIWAQDSRSVILSQTLLPLPADTKGRKEKNNSERKTVEVNVLTGEFADVGRRCHLAVAWGTNGLTCQAAASATETMLKQLNKSTYFKSSSDKDGTDECPKPEVVQLRKVGRSWRAAASDSARKLVISLREGMNVPPTLHYEIRGQSAGTLWDLNPALNGTRVAEERQIAWEWSKGHRIVAGLYYPVGYRPGRRYPLVIQTHGFDPGRFEFFGPYSTAFAARPLAGRGMFVLQVQDIYLPGSHEAHGQFKSVDRAIKIYESGISYLAAQGLVDPAKVGIIGFSYTGFYVEWALSHNPTLFAAASVTEASDGGYLDYITGWRFIDASSLYGGPPFGESLKQWVKLSPNFNLDRVRSPMLITEQHPSLILVEWEWFEGLRDLKRPVEMMVLDDDDHLLQKPWDRLVSEGENVDWFDFWLNGHEDEDPGKATQYQRWRRLRARYQCEHQVAATCASSG